MKMFAAAQHCVAQNVDIISVCRRDDSEPHQLLLSWKGFCVSGLAG